MDEPNTQPREPGLIGLLRTSVSHDAMVKHYASLTNPRPENEPDYVPPPQPLTRNQRTKFKRGIRP